MFDRDSQVGTGTDGPRKIVHGPHFGHARLVLVHGVSGVAQEFLSFVIFFRTAFITWDALVAHSRESEMCTPRYLYVARGGRQGYVVSPPSGCVCVPQPTSTSTGLSALPASGRSRSHHSTL
jgi:hypothetical protein